MTWVLKLRSSTTSLTEIRSKSEQEVEFAADLILDILAGPIEKVGA